MGGSPSVASRTYLKTGSRLMALTFFLASVCFGQSVPTSINLATQGRNIDFSNFPFTRPVAVGALTPATCSVGQLFFNSSAPSGSNLLACTSANSWASMGQGGQMVYPGAGIATSTGTSWGSSLLAPVGSLVGTGQANTFAAGLKQSVQSSASTAGLNLGGISIDPSTLTAGDQWFRTDQNRLKVYDGAIAQSVAWLSDLGNATTINGASMPASQPCIGTNSNGQPIAGTCGGAATGSGTVSSTTASSGQLPLYSAATTVAADPNLDDSVTSLNALTYKGSGGVTAPSFQSSSTAAGCLYLGGSTSGVASLCAQPVAGTYTLLWPNTAGASGQVLTSGGSGQPMTWTNPSGTSSANGGVSVQVTSYTLQASDSGTLVVFNCSAACTATLPSSPVGTFHVQILSVGSNVATVSLNGTNYNGNSTAPVLNTFRPLALSSDGTNYWGDAPIVAGSGITITPSSSNFTIASTTSGNTGISGYSNLSYTDSSATLALGSATAGNLNILYTGSSSTGVAGIGLGNAGGLHFTGTGFTTSGIYQANAVNLYSVGSGGLDMVSTAAPIIFATGANATNRFQIDTAGHVQVMAGTYSSLPACNSSSEGSRASVTDSTATTFGTTISGGGTNHVPAYCNGTNWMVE